MNEYPFTRFEDGLDVLVDEPCQVRPLLPKDVFVPRLHFVL